MSRILCSGSRVSCAWDDVQQAPAELEDGSRGAALALRETVSKSVDIALALRETVSTSVDVASEREVRSSDAAIAEREWRLRIMLHHEGVRAIASTTLSGVSGRIASS
jgi:hypothetical protein